MTHNELVDQLMFQLKEVERLREALKRMIDNSEDGNFSSADSIVPWLREIAREALEER